MSFIKFGQVLAIVSSRFSLLFPSLSSLWNSHNVNVGLLAVSHISFRLCLLLFYFFSFYSSASIISIVLLSNSLSLSSLTLPFNHSSEFLIFYFTFQLQNSFLVSFNVFCFFIFPFCSHAISLILSTSSFRNWSCVRPWFLCLREYICH